MEVLPLNNLAQFVKAVSIKWNNDNRYFFQLLETTMCIAAENGFKQVENCLVRGGQVLR